MKMEKIFIMINLIIIMIIIKLLSSDSIFFNYNYKRDNYSPKLYSDLSDEKSKHDIVKENTKLYDEEISHIYENLGINDKLNKSFSNSDNYDIKLINKFFNLNKTQVNGLDSQNYSSNNQNDNEASLSNESKNYSSLNYDDNIDIRFQSKSIILAPYIEPNDSSYLTFSNRKRERSKIKDINLFPNIENNFMNKSESLAIKKNYKDKIFIIKKKNFGRKKKNSGETGKHNKYSKDNLRSKAKTCSLSFLLEYFNEELKKIDINNLNKSVEWKLYQIKTEDNKTKVYFFRIIKSISQIYF